MVGASPLWSVAIATPQLGGGLYVTRMVQNSADDVFVTVGTFEPGAAQQLFVLQGDGVQL
jgi:hypothetical protein